MSSLLTNFEMNNTVLLTIGTMYIRTLELTPHKIEILCPLIRNGPFPPPRAPGNHHSALWFCFRLFWISRIGGIMQHVPSVTGLFRTQCTVLMVHSYCHILQNFLLLKDWLLLHCLYIPQFPYLFIQWWTFGYFHILVIVTPNHSESSPHTC